MNELIKIDLVEVKNDQLVTDSRKVAESFGKEHKNVIASRGRKNSKYYPAPLDVLAVVGLLVAAWAWMWLLC